MIGDRKARTSGSLNSDMSRFYVDLDCSEDAMSALVAACCRYLCHGHLPAIRPRTNAPMQTDKHDGIKIWRRGRMKSRTTFGDLEGLLTVNASHRGWTVVERKAERDPDYQPGAGETSVFGCAGLNSEAGKECDLKNRSITTGRHESGTTHLEEWAMRRSSMLLFLPPPAARCKNISVPANN